jgi:hypothetical protein
MPPFVAAFFAGMRFSTPCGSHPIPQINSLPPHHLIYPTADFSVSRAMREAKGSPMPISEKQLSANRANAAKSTGPRTPEGKSRSSQNARKHGFTASTFAVVRLEDIDEVARLRADLIAVYQPRNSQELFALERMALTQQTMLRAARLESGLFTTCLDMALDPNGNPLTPMSPDLVGDIEITRAQNRNYALADGFHRTVRQDNSWPLFLRYQAQAERHYRLAVEEFDRLKALRTELPKEPISEVQPEENETTCAPPDEPISPSPPDSQPGSESAGQAISPSRFGGVGGAGAAGGAVSVSPAGSRFSGSSPLCRYPQNRSATRNVTPSDPQDLWHNQFPDAIERR